MEVNKHGGLALVFAFLPIALLLFLFDDKLSFLQTTINIWIIVFLMIGLLGFLLNFKK